MISRPAQFLLRFDDFCPTMDRRGWQRFLPLIEEYGLRPIVGVVPDNRDPDLACGEPNPGFWDEMRDLQAAGATIGLHGYRHLCNSSRPSLLPLHSTSEFAGVPEITQQEWIHAGVAILRRQGLMPRIFIAPRHGFDRNTLRAVYESGIMLVSDGFARCPFVRHGLTWIPQQLWEPAEETRGLWTICLHCNTASDELVGQLRNFLRQHGSQFTSMDRVLTRLSPSRLTPYEYLYEKAALLRFKWRQNANRRTARRSRAIGENAPNAAD